MNKSDNIPKSQTENNNYLLCEIRDLRAELAKVKRQWAEDDRDITALEDENNRLLDELTAERKKREEAENVLAMLCG
jgi:septal ring factor EnvC (AmiA/AmiB activator)